MELLMVSDTTSNASARRRRSAGIVLWRRRGDDIEVLLGHMGGPYWARKDRGAWTIPKGEVEAGEEPLAVAAREFEEELGVPVPAGELVDLGEVRQSGGKIVRAWAVEGDLDTATVVEQHLRTRVATAVRTYAGVSRNRPRRMVRRADRTDQGRDRPTSADRPGRRTG